MELVIKEAGAEFGTGIGTDVSCKTTHWHTVDLKESEIWFDATGVGWDTSYVSRFEALRTNLHGALICAWDTEYDQIRTTWTGKVNCWPVAMVQCMRMSDIKICEAFAQEHGITIITRSEDQSPSAEAINNGVLVLDLSWV